MVTLQSFQGNTSTAHLFKFLTYVYGYSGAQDWAPKCPYVKRLRSVG